MDQENSSEPMQQENYSQNQTAQTDGASNAAPAQSTADDIGDHKLFAILGYILPFLFFIPLIQDTSKNNAFARFHANQQLILLVIWLGVYVLSSILFSMLMMGTFFLMPLINLALLVLAIIGIINAAQGQMKELPLVGNFNLVDKLFK